MTKKVEAWESEDGTLFPSELSAARHDARRQLLQWAGVAILGDLIQMMVEEPQQVTEILAPLLKEMGS